MKTWLVVLSLILGYAGSVFAGTGISGDRLEKFLASRVVVATVDFAPGSSKLDGKAIAVLKGALPALSGLDRKQKVLRIEGLSQSSIKGDSSLDLCIRRAQAISKFLKAHQKMDVQPYLVGFGNKPPEKVKDGNNRVAIVVYDDIWDLKQTGLETITKLQK